MPTTILLLKEQPLCLLCDIILYSTAHRRVYVSVHVPPVGIHIYIFIRCCNIHRIFECFGKRLLPYYKLPQQKQLRNMRYPVSIQMCTGYIYINLVIYKRKYRSRDKRRLPKACSFTDMFQAPYTPKLLRSGSKNRSIAQC